MVSKEKGNSPGSLAKWTGDVAMSLLLERIPDLVSGNAGAKPHFLAVWGQLLKKYDFPHTVTLISAHTQVPGYLFRKSVDDPRSLCYRKWEVR